MTVYNASLPKPRNHALLALAFVGSVATVPPPFDCPEVIPDPGLPSLACLGLTSKGLYEGTGLLGNSNFLTLV